jgi:hypothetical protein
MKDSQIESAMAQVSGGKMDRTQLLQMKTNAESRLGDNPRIQELIDLIGRTAVPSLEAEYVFMGYCPGGDIENRRDIEWIKDGFIDFAYIESKAQLASFCAIHAGDKIILKKRHEFGETMKIHAYGEVTESAESKSTGLTYHRVDWKIKDVEIIVPLLGCNATVNKRNITQVDEGMTQEFWDWLKQAA